MSKDHSEKITLKQLSARKKLNTKKHRPVFLITGTPSSGKTALLNTVTPSLINTEKQTVSNAYTTAPIEWWSNAHISCIDTKETDLSFACIKKFYGKRAHQEKIKGVFIIFSLPQLLEHGLSEETRHDIDRRASLLADLGHPPATIIFTGCDRLSGFNAFFSDLTEQERAHPWGIQFDECLEEKGFAHYYDEWLSRLTHRLLLRLHQEHDLEKRTALKNFPLQIEQCKATINDIVEQLSSTTSTLSGIYCTSATQHKKDAVKNYLLDKETPHSDVSPNLPSTPFFCTDLLSQPSTYFFTAERKRKMFSTWVYRSAYTAALFLIVAGTTLSVYQYNKEKALLVTLDTTLKFYDGSHPSNLHDALSVLKNQPHFLKLGLAPSARMETVARQQYQHFLTATLLPKLREILEKNITESASPSRRYQALKIYLMLGDPTHFEATPFQNWWRTLLYDAHTTQTSQTRELLEALKYLSKENMPPTLLNQTLVQQARTSLQALSREQLNVLALEDRYHNEKDTSLTVPGLASLTIPALYTHKHVLQILNNDIPDICEATNEGDWVLQNQKPSLLSNAAQIEHLQALYLKNYVDTWSHLLDALRFRKTNDHTEVLAMINTVLNNTSAISNVIQTIIDNTATIDNAPSFNESVTAHFKTLSPIAPELRATPVYETLSALQQYLHAAHTDKAAFTTSIQRLQSTKKDDPITHLRQLAASMSTPSSTWLDDIALNSWRVLLHKSHAYIAKQWRIEALPFYQARLDRRYPLFNTADNDITLTDFTQFFGPDGIMSNFFEAYLAPFVDTRHFYWQWNERDGEHLEMEHINLEMFIRASLIERMFFPGKSPTPATTFRLIPIELGPTVKTMALHLLGHTFLFSHHRLAQHALAWPHTPSQKAVLRFTTQDNKDTSETETGPWALFRLLDRAHLHATSDAKRFALTFDLNGKAAKFELATDHIVNPFIPSIINNFRCPERL